MMQIGAGVALVNGTCATSSTRVAEGSTPEATLRRIEAVLRLP